LGVRVLGFYYGDTEVSFFTTELRRERREAQRKVLGVRVLGFPSFQVFKFSSFQVVGFSSFQVF